jgi:hypothetical protein
VEIAGQFEPFLPVRRYRSRDELLEAEISFFFRCL